MDSKHSNACACERKSVRVWEWERVERLATEKDGWNFYVILNAMIGGGGE